MKPETQWTCEDVRADLPLYVGGDLSLDEHQVPSVVELRQHIEACSACALELESLRRSREAFLSLGEDCEAPGLWPDVRAVLAAEGILSSSSRPAPGSGLAGSHSGLTGSRLRLVGLRAGVAAALMLGLGVFAWRAIDGVGGSTEEVGPMVAGAVDAAHDLGEDVAREVGEVSATPELSALASRLRALAPGELALSEGAEVFGVDAGLLVLTPSHTAGGASAAGLMKIR